MAESKPELNKETFFCSICLDLLKEPVTIPCGHSYCMSCVHSHWNEEACKQSYSCPQCRQNFTQRPVLVKNTVLAVLMAGLKKTGLPAAPGDRIYAAHGDVGCDLCSGRKLKAVKSCLQCLVSYCEDHLQPHYDVAALKRHKLVEPCENLQDIICSEHNEVMKMFCRTDQQCICYLCTVDQHKGHDIVTAVEERAGRKRDLEAFQQKIIQRIKNKQKDVLRLQHEVMNISGSADTAVQTCEISLKQLISCVETNICDAKCYTSWEHTNEKHNLTKRQDELQQEISELRRQYTEIETVSHTEDHCKFLQNVMFLSDDETDSDSPSTTQHTLVNTPSPQDGATEELPKGAASQNRSQQKRSPPYLDIYKYDEPLPMPRDELLQYACDITLDPNTANKCLALSDGNRKVFCAPRGQTYHKHPERFTHKTQVLSKEALPDQCYIEINLDFASVSAFACNIAVAYKDIQRNGDSGECQFGENNNSWLFVCLKSGDILFHYDKELCTKVSTGCKPSRVGIYLDHDSGLLQFYKLDEPKSLLLEIMTNFTQPLYLGIGLDGSMDTLEICKLT